MNALATSLGGLQLAPLATKPKWTQTAGPRIPRANGAKVATKGRPVAPV